MQNKSFIPLLDVYASKVAVVDADGANSDTGEEFLGIIMLEIDPEATL